MNINNNNDQYLVKGSVSVSLILARTIAEYFRQSSCCVCRGRVGGCGDLSATRVMQIYQGAGEGGAMQAKWNSFKHYLVKLFTWWNIAAIESAFSRVFVNYGTDILKTDYCQRFNWFPKAGPGKAELMKDLDQADPPSHQSVRKPLWRVKYEIWNV